MLLLDICSSRTASNIFPQLSNKILHCLLLNTTSQLQSLDAEPIAAVKFRYHHRQMEHVTKVVEIGESETYKVGLLMGMGWLISVWDQKSSDITFKCWRATGVRNKSAGVELDLVRGPFRVAGYY